MSEAQSLHCPTCGAPLNVGEGATIVDCSYCKNAVIVPEALRRVPLAQQAPSSLSPVNLGDIFLLVANNRKIEAIKQVRETTGLGLKQAKDVVEGLERGDPMALVNVLATGGNASPPADTYLSVKVNPPVSLTTVPMDAKQRQKVARAIGVGGATASCGVLLFILFMFAVTVVPILFALAADGGPLAPLASKLNPFSFAAVDLSLGEEGIGPGQFTDPRSIAVDRQGNFFVADYSTGRIQAFDSQGKFRWLVNLGDKVIIQSMEVGSGEVLYVASQGKLRRFESAAGKELEPFQDPEKKYYFEDVAAAPDGRLALIYNGENVLVLDSDLQPVFEIPGSVSSVTDDSELDSNIDVDATGNIYILGTFNRRVLKYSSNGKYLNQFGGEAVDEEDGKFRAVGDLAVDMDGRVYVSDVFGIQVFDGEGRFLERFRVAQYAHGMNFDLQNHLYITDNKPQVMRVKLRQ